MQVSGSGVVYSAEVRVPGKNPEILGLRNNLVVHGATNVKSSNQVIGETSTAFTVAATSSNGGGPCTGGGSTPVSVELPIEAKLIGVDGNAIALGQPKKLYVEQTASGAPANTKDSTTFTAQTAKETQKFDCIWNKRRIWDAVNGTCTSKTPDAGCNAGNVAASAISAGARSLINQANASSSRKILTCVSNSNFTFWYELEILGQCDFQIWSRCEHRSMDPSAGAAAIVERCISQM